MQLAPAVDRSFHQMRQALHLMPRPLPLGRALPLVPLAPLCPLPAPPRPTPLWPLVDCILDFEVLPPGVNGVLFGVARILAVSVNVFSVMTVVSGSALFL